MPAFLIADLRVPDLEKYRDSGYIQAVPGIAAKFGGVYRARGGEARSLEGAWHPERLVIIEFPDMDSLVAFYESDEYAPYKKIRQSLAESSLVALEGLEPDAVP